MSESKYKKHRIFVGLLSSLLFLTHPIQTQAVTYIWQRLISLAAMFYVMSLYLFLKARLCHHKKMYIAFSFLTAILAMFTKENCFTLPFLVVVIEKFFFNKNKRGWKPILTRVLPYLLLLPIIPLTLTRADRIASPFFMPPTAQVDISENQQKK